MRRAIVLCLAAVLGAGCREDKKPTEPPPAFPDQPKQPPRGPGKKQTGPGMSQLLTPLGDMPGICGCES